MLAATLKSLAVRYFPAESARIAARRRFAGLRVDHNNFSDPAVIPALAAGHDIASFDLFDTIVTRTVSLQDIHAKTAAFADRYLRGDDGPLPPGLLLDCRYRFQEAVKARGAALATGFRNEIDLADVFDGALAPHIADPSRRARAVAALIGYEVETEKRVLRVDPAMPPELRALRADGKTVILVSDMYLAAPHLQAILVHLGIAHLFDAVVVSASTGLTKASGRLFGHVDAVLGLEGRHRIPFGDSWNNDFLQPRRMGWNARHYFRREHEERKAALEIETRHGGPSPGPAARSLTHSLLPGGPDDTLQLAGAAFSIFGRRVLEAAIRDGCDRILFLSRDGTIFHDVISAGLAASGAEGLPVPRLGHLAFSRRIGVILNLPETVGAAWTAYLDHNVHWLTGRESTLAALLDAFALPPDEVGLTGAGADLVLAGEAVGALPLSSLLEYPALAARLHAALARRQDNARAYLDQEGIFDRAERIMLVDIGYSGTAAKALSEQMFRREARGQPVRSRITLMLLAANRYFQLNRRLMHPRIHIPPAALIGTRTRADRAVAANFAWLEPFAVDRTRGSLRDYDRDATGRLVPRFAPPGADAAESHQLRQRLIAAAGAYEAAVRASRLDEADADAHMTRRFVRHFLNPGADTVRAMAQLSHHAGLAEIDASAVVGQIRLHRLLHDLRACHQHDKWLQGSLRASGLGPLIPFFNGAIASATR